MCCTRQNRCANFKYLAPLKLIKNTAANSRFAKAAVSYFYDSEVLNSSFVLLMKFSAKNPPHSQSGKTSLAVTL